MKLMKTLFAQDKENEVVSFVKSGLKDLSISRKSFSWDTSSSNKNHVIYVWLDALTNYISALNYPDNKNNLYRNFLACRSSHDRKRYIKISRSILASILLAADLPTPKRVYGHGWILSGVEKCQNQKVIF